MNPRARLELAALVAAHGPELAADPRRCRALLLDMCGDCRKEISVITASAYLGIPKALGRMNMTSQVLHTLARRLENEHAITDTAALWAVESWAEALGALECSVGGAQLDAVPLANLHSIASTLSVHGYRRMRRPELVGAIVKRQSTLEHALLADLHAIASALSIHGYRRLRRDALVATIIQHQ